MIALQRISSCERGNSFGDHDKSFSVTWCVYVTYETGSEQDAHIPAKLSKLPWLVWPLGVQCKLGSLLKNLSKYSLSHINLCACMLGSTRTS